MGGFIHRSVNPFPATNPLSIPGVRTPSATIYRSAKVAATMGVRTGRTRRHEPVTGEFGTGQGSMRVPRDVQREVITGGGSLGEDGGDGLEQEEADEEEVVSDGEDDDGLDSPKLRDSSEGVN